MCGVWEADVCCARGIFGLIYGVAPPISRFGQCTRSMKYEFEVRHQKKQFYNTTGQQRKANLWLQYPAVMEASFMAPYRIM
jgi:hypothetical protein